jgi:hypothetical protein
MRTAFALAVLLAAALPSAAQSPTVARDIPTVASGMGGAGGGPFTLYSLATRRVVPNADSASTAWDLGFRGTTVILNGGASGPGKGAVAIVDAPFEAVTAAPADSLFRTDGTTACPRGPALALCSGSGVGWYDYVPTGNLIVPVPGRTLVVRRADGALARLRIVSYYRGAPEVPGSTEPRFYTFAFAPLDGEAPKGGK